MAEPDCGACAAAGYRSCDRCGGPVFPDGWGFSADDLDVCGYCAGGVSAAVQLVLCP